MPDVHVTAYPGIFEFECDVSAFRDPEPGERIPVYYDPKDERVHETDAPGRYEIGFVVRVVPRRAVHVLLPGTDD